MNSTIFRDNCSDYYIKAAKALDHINNQICKKHRIELPSLLSIYDANIETFPLAATKTLVFSPRTKRHFNRIKGALPELVSRYRRALISSGYPDRANKKIDIVIDFYVQYVFDFSVK